VTAAVERVEVLVEVEGAGLGLEGIGEGLGVEGLVPEMEGEWEVRPRRAGDGRICAPWLCIMLNRFVVISQSGIR
jgi:hypothetical protein